MGVFQQETVQHSESFHPYCLPNVKQDEMIHCGRDTVQHSESFYPCSTFGKEQGWNDLRVALCYLSLAGKRPTIMFDSGNDIMIGIIAFGEYCVAAKIYLYMSACIY